MHKVFIITRKELVSALRQRNFLLLSFLSPIVLVTIIALAFGGLGRSGTPDFADIRIAVVNLDQGVEAGVFPPSSAPLRFGDRLAAVLLSQPATATTSISGAAGGFELGEPACPLTPDAEASAEAGSLEDWFDASAADDPAAAQAGVENGDFAAAVIIPPEFSRRILPSFALTGSEVMTPVTAVEVFANPGTPVAAAIVRAVVEGIVARFEQVSVAAHALASITPNLALTDAAVLAPLGCLLLPQAGSLQIRQQPLDPSQDDNLFGMLMVGVGSAQAIFFALFTGVFGINAIYEDRIQGTLQRLLVTPTPTWVILAGRLLGNLAIVMMQLLVLMVAFAGISMLVEQSWYFIWGDNVAALLLVVAGLSLFTTGLGVLIVGLAATSEQVQIFGPIITIGLSMLSGSFGLVLPRPLAQLSPIWWGLEAIHKLAAHETDIALHLLVLFGAGLLFAGVGTYFFRRRMGL